MSNPEVTNLTWFVITLLVTFVGSAIKYLLNRIRVLEDQLKESTKANSATNALNARMAEMWIDQKSGKGP